MTQFSLKCTGSEPLDLSSLCDLKRLEILEIYFSSPNLINPEQFSNCTKLRYLYLKPLEPIPQDEITSFDLAPFRNCCNLESLDLVGLNFTNLDLAPLTACTQLKTLVLDWNRLQTIDLAPLGHCQQFTFLSINYNELHSIDLEPLSNCPEFKCLSLQDNDLRAIDLSPLKDCSQLDYLGLEKNLLLSLDLTPLKDCLKLESLIVHTNQLEELDITPIYHLPKLTEFGYEAFSSTRRPRHQSTQYASRFHAWLAGLPKIPTLIADSRLSKQKPLAPGLQDLNNPIEYY